MNRALLNKSIDWQYEQEFRTVFLTDHLEELRKQKLAYFKEFGGKKSWFLRLHPASIKKIIFGLYTEESLKSVLRELKNRSELQHVKIYNATESTAYELNLVGE